MTSPAPELSPSGPAEETLVSIAQGRYWNPHSVLGGHVHESGVTFRALRPLASAVSIILPDAELPMRHEREGLWVATAAELTEVPDYRVRTTYGTDVTTVDDPYRHLPTMGELDLHLIAEGRHEELWRVMGAHVRSYPSSLGEVTGTSFTVWAPSATAVRVIGDFNHWQGRSHAMRSLGASGIWEIFVPGVTADSLYKFEILGSDGSWRHKADPMARSTQVPPETASAVTHSTYEWNDGPWMVSRIQRDPHAAPMSVYEVHLASWRPGLSYRELAAELTAYVSDLGFTHVEFMPVAEHPFGGSWGYQVTSYYAPTSRFGNPDDLRYLIDTLHQAGIGVILDWVPAHFPKDEWALARFDGTALYEDPNPLRGEHPDWGTYVFNFGRAEVRNFLVANASYWFEEFHVDGLRVDAVASMLYLDYSRQEGQWSPNIHGGRENLEAIAFLQEACATAYRRNPGIMMIAEESTAFPGVTATTDTGGLGFGLKWNMGWMNDTLKFLERDPIHRSYHHGEATFSLVYAYSEQFVLPLSHDEVVHGKGSLYGKMPGDDWQKRAGLRTLYAYQWTHPGKQLLFMGQEFAQRSEWSEAEGLPWHEAHDAGHPEITRLIRDLNHLYRTHPALWELDFSEAGFTWINGADSEHSVLSYLRHDRGGRDLAVLINFAATPHENYRVGLPSGGVWEELLNTDAEIYGGSGVGNLGQVQAEVLPWDGQPYSVKLRVPPLGALILRPRSG